MTWLLVPGARFADHAQAWDELQSQTTNTPFLESAFISPLLEVFGSGREMLALHRRDGGAGELDAAALVHPAGRGQWQTFQPSQLPLGPWLAAADTPLEATMRDLMCASVAAMNRS